MKCISCNNLIPDASTVCPYCNNKVEPAAAPTPVYNVTETPAQTPVVPATPAEAVLPQDQGMNGINMQPPVNPAAAPVPPMNMAQPQAPEFTPMSAPTSDVVTPVTAPAPEPTMNAPQMTGQPEVVSSSGELMDGAKVGKTGDAPKKDSKKMVIVAIILIVILAGAGLGIFYYYSQYKTTDKRIDTVINAAFKESLSFQNEQFEKASGKYNLEGSIEVEDQKMSAKMSGIYAYDLPNGIMDYTLNLESVNLGEELLDAGAINLELYIADSNIYLLLQNFYDKYIYMEVDGLQETLETMTKEQVNYQTIMAAVRDALKAGLKSASTTQTVKDVTVNGKKTKANVVKIVINDDNQEKVMKAIKNSLANNAAFVKEIAKLTGEDEATVKESLLKEETEEATSLEDEAYVAPTEITIEIQTDMFKENLVGVNCVISQGESKQKLEVYPITSGYGYIIYDDDKKIADAEIATTKNQTSTSRETNTSAKITVYTEETGAVKLNFTTNVTDDVAPKVEKVSVRNSVNINYMTPTELLAIYDKVAAHGNLGMLVESLVGSTIAEYRAALENPGVTIPTDPTTGGGTTVTPSTGTEVPIY